MSDPRGPQDKVIDAEVEPLGKGGQRRGILRIVVLLVLAVVVSVGVAALLQLQETGRLPSIFGGPAKPAAPVQVRAPQPAPSSQPTPPAMPAAAATAAPAATDAALLQRLDEQEKRLAALTASLERLQQLPAANAGDPQKLAALEQARLDADAARLVLQQRVAEIDARLAALAESRSAALREPLLVLLSWTELRERAGKGLAYEREAAAIAAYAESQTPQLVAAFAPVANAAAAPPPPAVLLAPRFAAALERQRAAPAAPGADADAAPAPWWQRAIDKVTGLVSIRRIGAADPGSVAARLDAAEAAMAGADIAAAVAALEGIDAASPLADWRQQAQARLDLDAALARFGAALRDRFAVR